MQTFFDHLNSLSRDYTRRHGAFFCRTPFGRSRLRRPVSGRCTDPADPTAGQGAAERGDVAALMGDGVSVGPPSPIAYRMARALLE